MEYALLIKPSAESQMNKLSSSMRAKIVEKLEKLTEDPRPNGAVKLKGPHNFWRIRVGDYRVIYSIDDATRIIDVSAVRHRRDAYRHL